MLVLKSLAWLGIVAALVSAAICVIMSLPRRRARKIIKTTARYARRFPVLIVLAALGSLSSCTSPILYNHSSDAFDGLPAVSSISEAWEISSAIVYDGSLDCKTPARTYHDGYGDCKDIAALMVALLESADIEAVLVRLHYGDGQHMIVRVNGYLYIEPQCYGAYYDGDELEIMCYYTLDEYLGGAVLRSQ
jgi:hypothetical protein